MKKIITISLIAISLNANAQTSVKPKIDSIQKVDTTYAIILNKSELQFVLSLFKLQDEKPGIINGQINAIDFAAKREA